MNRTSLTPLVVSFLSQCLRSTVTAALLLGGVTLSSASAAIIQFDTLPLANIDGEPVKARATFTTSTDSISILIENLQADPNSVKQVIYDLQFLVTTGQNSGTIDSITAVERSIANGGSYADGPVMARTGALIDWNLNTVGTYLHLDRLTVAGQKKHGIIGPPKSPENLYVDANNSITGATHNPFFGGSATFLLNVPGVTSASSIKDVSFSFNTTPGSNVPGVVPEPGVYAALGLLLPFVAWRMRRA
ncbi:MAG: hypothetical protein SFX18_06980 [Pirellulales bacterium]|nr:hypothetical protein [Pirellulales bacterium]